MEVQTKKRFMHHYNFPPFSVGETGRIGSTNRRMVGHGALAEKALLPILPAKEDFPYTIRIVSEALASNGSTSMGSVCGSTLALMDGGVPIKAAVAGIASGLMMESPTKYKVLTDIQGPEDHHGDMDFKVAGTKEGITAVQMDVKVGGIPLLILREALEKAKSARLKILEVMLDEISLPRKELSPNAPRILFLKIKPAQIGMVIGTGGKIVNEIREKTGTEIDIEDDGTVYITGKSPGAEEAQRIIAALTREYTAGERFEGEVIKIAEFGAFIKIGPNAEGLAHISEMAPWRVAKVTDLVRIGDKVPVVIKGTDDRGKIKLSIKDADPTFFKKTP
jgi:polyribonucleotide nucleotidyltransferase